MTKIMVCLYLLFSLIFSTAISTAEDSSSLPQPDSKMTWAERMAWTTLREHPEAWSMRKSDGAYRWGYTQGLVLEGMMRLYEQTGEARFYQYAKAYVDRYVKNDGTIDTMHMDEFNIDSVKAGTLLFPLYQQTEDARYAKAMETLMYQLAWQPRTTDGVFWHKRKYPYQIWLDGLYMGSPFYAQYLATYGDASKLGDVTKQFVLSEKHLRDDATGLLWHGFDESRIQAWADKETGLSANFWSRSMGWYAMALVDVLDYFPNDHAGRETLKAIFTRLIDGVVKYQDKSGLWYQVTNLAQREGNYLEASGSSMFVYAIAKGVRKGYLKKSYMQYAEKGFEGLTKTLMEVDKKTGHLRLTNICRSAGLGGDPYRDGSFEYYLSEDIVTNDAHGVGSFLLAAVEMEYKK